MTSYDRETTTLSAHASLPNARVSCASRRPVGFVLDGRS